MTVITESAFRIACIMAILIMSCKSNKENIAVVSNETISTPVFVDSISMKADSILGLMTLDEKLGQLNLPSSGDITTGQAQSSDIAKKIEEGKVGGLFNIKSVEKIRDVQKIANGMSELTKAIKSE